MPTIIELYQKRISRTCIGSNSTRSNLTSGGLNIGRVHLNQISSSFHTRFSFTKSIFFLLCLYSYSKSISAQKNIYANIDTTNFTNAFYIKPSFPSNISSFSLRLEKLVLGTLTQQGYEIVESYNEDSKYTQDAYRITTTQGEDLNSNEIIKIPENIVNIPEIVDMTDIQFYQSIKGKTFSAGTTFREVSKTIEVDIFNNSMPAFTILNNKLLTANYPSGKSESFIVQISRDSSVINNGNYTLTVSFANEDLTQKRKNMIWRLFTIEHEIYVALGYRQLMRLEIPLIPLNLFSTENEGSISYINPKGLAYDPTFEASTGFYMERLHTNTTLHKQIDPNSTLYLFKISLK
jgi:hypothetical protein